MIMRYKWLNNKIYFNQLIQKLIQQQILQKLHNKLFQMQVSNNSLLINNNNNRHNLKNLHHPNLRL